jgi:hypothetical protein
MKPIHLANTLRAITLRQDYLGEGERDGNSSCAGRDG